MLTTTAASKSATQSDPLPAVTESAALARLLDLMKEIVELENDRLDRELVFEIQTRQ